MPQRMNWNRWYGHFNPGRPTAVTTPGAEYLHAANAPITSLPDFDTFVRVTARVLPSFRSIAPRLLGREVPLKLTEGPVMLMSDEWGDPIQLSIPANRAPREYERDLFDVVASLAPLPEGIDLPPVETYELSREAMTSQLWRNFAWRAAVNKTFSFQMAYEMAHAGIAYLVCGEIWRFLHPSDAALFRTMRQDGLHGMALAFRDYVAPSAQATLDGIFAAIADRSTIGVMAAAPWEAPIVDARPDLPWTSLDIEAEQYLTGAEGLYSQAIISTVNVTEERWSDIAEFLREPVQRPEDLSALLSVGREIAPALWQTLDEGVRQSSVPGIQLGLIQRDPAVFPVVFAPTTYSELTGGKFAQDRSIGIVQGLPRWQALKGIVEALAWLHIPAFLHSRTEILVELLMDSSERRTHLIHRALRRNAIWGFSAVAELHHEAAQMGIEIELTPGEMLMKKLLERTDFWSLYALSHEIDYPVEERWGTAAIHQLAEDLRRRIVAAVDQST